MAVVLQISIIPFDLLYHQTLKRKLQANGPSIEIRTIRYERISTCLEKIISQQKEYDFDLLIFHLRAEPLMRMAKLYYKYQDNEGKLRNSINLPSFNLFYPEKFDLLSQRRIHINNQETAKESRLHHYLREANYLFGSYIGNKKFALKVLEKSVSEIKAFCDQNHLNFLLLGPVSRPFSKFENNLSEEINRKFSLLTKRNSIKYLNLLKTKTDENCSMFFENGIHVSQAGHNEIASMIFQKIIKENVLMPLPETGKS